VIEVQVAVRGGGHVTDRDAGRRERVVDERHARREPGVDLGIVRADPRIEQEDAVAMDDGVRDDRQPSRVRRRRIGRWEAHLGGDERDHRRVGHLTTS
jgi:hypothetical protein